jgi:TPR repeat protein
MYIRRFKAALESGDANFFGSSGREPDYSAAVEYYKKAAEGNPNPYAKNAQYKLGYCFEHGLGVEQNEAQALIWYKRSAEAGYKAAAIRLETGNAAPPFMFSERKEYTMADKITPQQLEQAAESGDTDAMYRYWLLCKDGEDGEAYFKALGWLEYAATLGHREAADAYNAYRADNGDDDAKEDQAWV